MSVGTPDVQTRRFWGAGLEIVADEAGPTEGPAVLLLHGGGQTRAAWGGALLEGARRGYRTISLDLRGHGDSGWAEDGDYGSEALARDLARVVEELGRPPVMVGASMGGLASLAYAGCGGELRALALVDIAPRIEPTGAMRILNFMTSAPNGFASLEEAAEAVAGYLPHRPRPRDATGLMKNLRLRPDGRLHWHWDPKLLAGAKQAMLDVTALRETARRLTAPVLLVRGGLSDVLSPEGVEDFLDLVPHAEVADIAGADHMVAGDRNDAFNRAVFDFLDRRL